MLIGDVLADKELHTLIVPFAELLLKLLHRQVFAAQAQDQHAARVRMAGKRRKKPARLGVVVAHLAAPERVREGIKPLDRAGHKVLVLAHQPLRNRVDTADRRDHPQLVADCRAPVGAAVALELGGLERLERLEIRDVPIVAFLGKIGLYIVDVYPLTRLDAAAGVPDRVAVFDDLPALGDLPQRDLVPALDIVSRHDGHAVRRHRFATPDIGERNRDVVVRMDMDQLHHSENLPLQAGLHRSLCALLANHVQALHDRVLKARDPG